MPETDKTKTATILGEQAYLNGLPRIPANDANLFRLLENVRIGHGKPILIAWLTGWDKANLAAPLR